MTKISAGKVAELGYYWLHQMGRGPECFVEGYEDDDINRIFPILQRVVDAAGIKGKLQVLWVYYNPNVTSYPFGGDSEWVLRVGRDVYYSVPVTLQEEDDLEEFVKELFRIKNGEVESQSLPIDHEMWKHSWNAAIQMYELY